jgi:hypothetical protein
LNIQSILQTNEERRKTDDPCVDHYSATRLAIFAKVVSASLALGILLIPVFLLFLKPMSREVMACIVAASVLVFTMIMSVVDMPIHELFVVLAA